MISSSVSVSRNSMLGTGAIDTETPVTGTGKQGYRESPQGTGFRYQDHVFKGVYYLSKYHTFSEQANDVLLMQWLTCLTKISPFFCCYFWSCTIIAFLDENVSFDKEDTKNT